MTANVASLLDVMKFRLSMCDSGRITPSAEVIKATRILVNELNALDSQEEIEITYSTNPFHAKYIRLSTGVVLAEFTVKDLSY